MTVIYMHKSESKCIGMKKANDKQARLLNHVFFNVYITVDLEASELGQNYPAIYVERSELKFWFTPS